MDIDIDKFVRLREMGALFPSSRVQKQFQDWISLSYAAELAGRITKAGLRSAIEELLHLQRASLHCAGNGVGYYWGALGVVQWPNGHCNG